VKPGEGPWRAPTPKGLNVKRSNERSEIIAPGATWGRAGEGPTPKGLNVKRSNERSEIIAPGETWGRAVEGPNPKGVECET